MERKKKKKKKVVAIQQIDSIYNYITIKQMTKKKEREDERESV
jgi:hypothetical protein